MKISKELNKRSLIKNGAGNLLVKNGIVFDYKNRINGEKLRYPY